MGPYPKPPNFCSDLYKKEGSSSQSTSSKKKKAIAACPSASKGEGREKIK
jgi:hypothetical protein